MAPSLTDIVEEARLSARALLDYGEHFFNPTVRLGVTGLSRAGKTVFITALIHGLTRGGRFPVFEPFATGRIARAHLEPQPDDAVPRFDYENHLQQPDRGAVLAELDGRYQRIAARDRLPAASGADRTLTLDIVDYPGEWLLDLPLLNKRFEQWSAESLALSREKPRAHLASEWHAQLATLDPADREDEQATLAAARLFTDYLRACRDERFAMSLLPPGRFLMPGNLAGSPALTFCAARRARRRCGAGGIAVGDDGAGATRPIRTSSFDRSFATILPGSIARSCWSMRWPRSTPAPKRCTIWRRRSPVFSIVSGSDAAQS